jgi:integrase
VLGAHQLSRISPADVRAWHPGLVRSCGSSSIVPAKCYRLLRAILTTAVDDELIARNPCVLKRAGVERASERPVASAAQVWELSEAVDERYRSFVLLAGFAGLRLGELLGLQRRDLALSRAIVTVERQMQELSDSSFVIGPPKTDAGARTLTLPPLLVDELALHIGGFVEDDQEALIFTGVKGGPLRRHVWNTCWREAVIHSSLPNEFRFHDLRHTANTLAAATPGISTKDLMHRMGHASDRAALLYQHATSRQDAAIASAIDAIAEGARTSPHSRRLKALDRPANS